MASFLTVSILNMVYHYHAACHVWLCLSGFFLWCFLLRFLQTFRNGSFFLTFCTSLPKDQASSWLICCATGLTSSPSLWIAQGLIVWFHASYCVKLYLLECLLALLTVLCALLIVFCQLGICSQVMSLVLFIVVDSFIISAVIFSSFIPLINYSFNHLPCSL